MCPTLGDDSLQIQDSNQAVYITMCFDVSRFAVTKCKFQHTRQFSDIHFIHTYTYEYITNTYGNNTYINLEYFSFFENDCHT